MPLIKIIKDYQPKEGWKTGDIVDVSNADALVREGNALLVNDKGDEIEHRDDLKQLRRIVKTINGIELVNGLIAKHPEKESIVAELAAEGVVNPIVVTSKKVEPDKIEVLPERVKVNVSKEEIMARVEEIKKNIEKPQLTS